MGAYILAGIVFVATLAIAALQGFAAGMSDVPDASSGAWTTIIIGFPLAALIAASHFLPHMGW